MKKKLAMRIASLAVCIVFTGMLFGAPKSKAVVTETAVGTAVLAGYMTATGIPLTVINGGASTVTAGVASMASSYATATGAAASGSAWLSSLAAGCSISPAGLLVLSAAAVIAIGAFVAWYVNENGLEEEGDTVTALPGTSDTYSYNGLELPSIDLFWVNKTELPFAIIYTRADNGAISCEISNVMTFVDEANGKLAYSSSPVSCAGYVLSGSSWESEYNVQNNSFVASIGYLSNIASINWTNYDLFCDDGSLSLSSSNPVPVGDVDNQLDVVLSSIFVQPDLDFAEDDTKEMQLDFGTPLTTLDDFAISVPDQIANNTLAVTYEVVDQAGEGEEGTTPDTGTDAETGIYIPILSDIKNVLDSLADAIVDGFKGLFIPSDTAIDSLSAEVDSKLPFILTLQGFGDDLVYNLEHPEECVDGLGLTTVVDLSKGRGSYLGDTKHELLDVSWYLEYKPLVDDIIVGFCWLCFLWNLYGALPRIIHGEGSTITVSPMDFPTVNEGSLTQKSLGPSDGKIWGEGGKWKMW